MSLYIGHDMMNDPVLHITSGTTSHSDMQSPTPIVDTVFHSNLNYISFTKYDCSFTSGVSTLYYGPYTPGAAIPETPNGVYIQLPTPCFDSIVVDDFIYIIELNRGGVKTLVLEHMTNLHSSNAIFFNTAHTSWSTTLLSPTHPEIFVKGNNITDVRVYVLNITTASYIPPVQDSSGILINNSSIIINGVDLASFCYMSTAIVNTVDSNPSLISSSVQFVNADLTGSSLRIFPIGSDYKITKSNHAIFDSSLGAQKVFFKSIVVANVPSASLSFNAGNYDYLLSSSIASGDTFLVTLTVDNGTTVNGPSFIMSYNEGDQLWVFQFNHPSIGGGDRLICLNGGLYLRRNVTYVGQGGSITANALTARVTILE